MLKEYWVRVCGQAFADTCQTLGLVSRQQIMIKVAIIFAVLLALAFWGSEDAASDEIILRLTLGGLGVFAFPLVYAWNLAAVPAEFDDAKNKIIEEGEAKLAAATASLTNKTTIRNNVLALSVLLEKGYDFNTKRISADQFDEWVSGLKAWETLTLQYIASKFSHQDAVAFSNVTFDPKDNFIFKISDDHNKHLQETAARLGKLREIIKRYEGDWSPISLMERKKINAALAAFEMQILAADGEQALNEESC
ncbi:MAG: hypothetical protein IID53_02595 [Proteobacteria bacterium]|nr:hypothetical protein [Pseudomonadota bacterium]